MRKCTKCGEIKELSEFHPRKDSKDGYRKDCKDCVNNRNLTRRNENIGDYRARDRDKLVDREKYRETKNLKYATNLEFRKKLSDYQKKYKVENKDKTYARQAVHYAVLYGRMIKPAYCEHCCNTSSSLEAHHWSYLEKDWLDIIWLCTSCHGKEHKRLNELGRDPDKQIKGETNDYTK